MTATMETAPTTAAAGPTGTATQRPSLLRLTGVELRKMADTRAGFWLLVTTGLVTVGVVRDPDLRRRSGRPDLLHDVPDHAVPDRDPAADPRHPVGHQRVDAAHRADDVRAGAATAAGWPSPRRSRRRCWRSPRSPPASPPRRRATLVAGAIDPAAGDWAITGSAIGYASLFNFLNVMTGLAFGMLLMNSAVAIVLYFVAADGVGGARRDDQRPGQARRLARHVADVRAARGGRDDQRRVGAAGRLGGAVGGAALRGRPVRLLRREVA